MNNEELKKVWQKFTDNNDFILNNDEELVSMVISSVLDNEREYGLKLCPCRLRDGTRARDLELICPCNFKAQEVWGDEGRCWCGLFIKRPPPGTA